MSVYLNFIDVGHYRTFLTSRNSTRTPKSPFLQLSCCVILAFSVNTLDHPRGKYESKINVLSLSKSLRHLF